MGALRVATAEHLLASTRMARAESEFIFQSIAAVREGRPPRVTTQDARTTLAVILAMYESARTGRPVALDPTRNEGADDRVVVGGAA